MNRDDVLKRLSKERPELERRFGVRRIAVFGSVARNEATELSDVDILVELDPPPSYDRFFELRFHLEKLLGTEIDLVTQAAVRPDLRPYIERELIDVA